MDDVKLALLTPYLLAAASTASFQDCPAAVAAKAPAATCPTPAPFLTADTAAWAAAAANADGL